MSSLRLWISLGILVVLSTACRTQYRETCPSSTPVGLANSDEIASDDILPFRFPLDESPIDDNLYFGWFGVSNECTPDILDCYEYPERKFHAAEDYKRPAGTPVYAMADGTISFSGSAGGYGWLILIDHPQANLFFCIVVLTLFREIVKQTKSRDQTQVIVKCGSQIGQD